MDKDNGEPLVLQRVGREGDIQLLPLCQLHALRPQ